MHISGAEGAPNAQAQARFSHSEEPRNEEEGEDAEEDYEDDDDDEYEDEEDDDEEEVLFDKRATLFCCENGTWKVD